MKLVSWNVNGLRACMNKGFLEFFKEVDADIFCVQETKMQQGQAEVPTEGYFQYWNSAEKKGYSGTAVFTKKKPLAVFYGIEVEEHGMEGRALTCEFETFYLVNIYAPNSQMGLARIDYRTRWEGDLRAYLEKLSKKKPVVLCGDLNVARLDIDLKNPAANRGSAGFSDQEREKMEQLLSAGFTDTFRALYPDKVGAYTWWSYKYHARDTNAGWRIDYFLISKQLEACLEDSVIYADVAGSDHCPIGLALKGEVL